MRLLNISVERFGILEDSSLNDLSPGLTVVYGPNGSGKSTLVAFVEGLLYGFNQEHEGYQPANQHYGGASEFESDGRSFRLARERSHGYSHDHSIVDLTSGVAISHDAIALPQWVNETVFKEIFSVGHHETDRFDLLSRLCLQDSGTTGSEDEIRRTEMAISDCIGERDGYQNQSGIRHQISELQARRQAFVAELEQMQQVSPHIPARIAEIEGEIGRLQSSLVAVEQQIRDVEEQIRRLELRIEELRRRNTVSLDRRELEQQLAELQSRQHRWDEIRKCINGEIGALQQTAPGLKNRDSLKSVRALVTRLEQRMEALSKDHPISASGTSQEVFVDHIRSEVYSLCDYVAQHESAIDAHEAELEKLFGQRTLQDAENVNTVLQGQIDACREELNRCEDILHIQAVPRQECTSAGHSAYRRTGIQRINGGLEELETELNRLRRQLDAYRTDYREITGRIRDLENELSRLQAELRRGASLEEIDRVKGQIAGIDSKLALLEQRCDVLNQTEANLREVLARLQQYRKPRVLELASDYMARLTDGDCFELIADDRSTTILARTRQADYPLNLNQLSHGTREQVGLALRLALVQCRAQDEQRCPLLLDDVFISTDDERAVAVADLLIEVARDGQQIVFFTCQKDVRDLFNRRDVTMRSLTENSRPLPLPPPVEVIPEPLPQPSIIMPVKHEPTPPPAPVDNSNWLYYLEVDNSVEDLSGLSVAEVEAIRAIGLEMIDELLSCEVEELETRFRDRGYSISRERIRSLRGQAEMSLLVPMLRRSDAELLYAAGIESTVELGRMRPETVYERVTSFQESPQGSRFRRSGRSIDRQQAINWSRWSQHSRTLSDARRSRSRFFVRSTDERNSPHASSGRTQSSSVSQRRERMKSSNTSTRRQPRPALSDFERQERDRRQTQRRRRMAQHSSSYRTRPENTSTEANTERELRFYLNRSDDVEAAPSIGPKTAQRLATVGVYTVDDLLTANAEDIATRLDNRRITAETIVQWQSQARLVCTVPELRGHDSQILVACGVTEAEQLSAKRPTDLFSVVGPFSETAEGERIIRGGKRPDLEEITDWIRFAQNARTLRAAA